MSFVECSKCKQKIKDTFSVCPYCQTPITGSKTPTLPVKKQHSKSLVMLVVSVIVLIAGLALGIGVIQWFSNFKASMGNGGAGICMIPFVLPFCLLILYKDVIIKDILIGAIVLSIIYIRSKTKPVLAMFLLSFLWGIIIGFVLEK